MQYNLLIALTLCSSMAYAMSAEDVVREIEQMGLPKDGFQARIEITPYKGGVAQESAQYLLRSRSRNQVLVEALEGEQKGQKFLSTNNGLFFFAPRTRRAIRITPLQALWGRAAVGDIARLSFSEDYHAEKAALPEGECLSNEACQAFMLTSKSDQATYTRILLMVRQHDGKFLPLRAHLYVVSGKLIKILEYGAKRPNLPPTVRYVDARDSQSFTELRYESVKPATFPAHLFNPRSLEQ